MQAANRPHRCRASAEKAEHKTPAEGSGGRISVGPKRRSKVGRCEPSKFLSQRLLFFFFWHQNLSLWLSLFVAKQKKIKTPYQGCSYYSGINTKHHTFMWSKSRIRIQPIATELVLIPHQKKKKKLVLLVAFILDLELVPLVSIPV